MNIQELKSRPSPSQYSIEECCFVVEQYIKKMRNVDVKINIYKNLDMTQMNHPVIRIMLSQQLQMLNNAFLEAIEKV